MPDHGKLAPWRFIGFEGEARRAAGEAIASAFRAKYPDAKPEHVAAERKNNHKNEDGCHRGSADRWLRPQADERARRTVARIYRRQNKRHAEMLRRHDPAE